MIDRRGAMALLFAATAVAAAGAEFRLPDVDLSRLPAPLREEALAAQRRAREAPSDPEALGLLGARYLAHDYPEAAAICLGRAAEIDPNAMTWHYYLGLALAEAGEVAEAIVSLGRAAALDPNYGAALVRQGDLLLEGDPARAGRLYRQALDLDAADATAWAGLGKQERMEGRGKEALRSFSRAVVLAPDYAEAHYAIAMLLISAGKSQEAAEHLRRHAAGGAAPIDRDPLFRDLIRMGQTAGSLRRDAERLSKAGRLDEAASLLERAIAIDVSGSTSRVHLGLIKARQGRFEEAAEQFRLALAADPADVEARSSLGLALAEMRRYDEALRVYGEVLAQHPDHAPTLVYMGQLVAREGRTEEALELLRRGVRQQPGNWLYQLTLGELLARAGEEVEAIEHLRKAVHLSPQHAGARYTLGVLLSRRGALGEARDQWEEAVRLDARLAGAWLGLAGVALSEGRSGDAVLNAERACELTAYADPHCRETLAAAYRAAGRPEDAARLEREHEREP